MSLGESKLRFWGEEFLSLKSLFVHKFILEESDSLEGICLYIFIHCGTNLLNEFNFYEFMASI